jgi:DNA-binding response OmpR family regulator
MALQDRPGRAHRIDPTVLVVDDDEDHVVMLEVVLEASGYEVITAHSCEEAKARLAERPVDALVTDLTLGDGTAIDLMRSLGERRPRLAIVLSGFDSVEDLESTRTAGFDAHLVKPTPLDQLTELIAEGLRRRRSGTRLAKCDVPREPESEAAPVKKSAG